MSFRSSTSSFRRSLALGCALFAAVWAALELARFPRTAFWGGRKLAQKVVALEAFERTGPVDVFVVGPSFVDQGFDAARFTAVTGKRCFNLGVSGTDMYFQSLLVRELVLPGRTPEAVLWGLRDEVLSRSNINRQYLAAPALAWARGPLGRFGPVLGQYLPHYHRRRITDWWGELFPAADEEVVDAQGRTVLATATRQERQAEREDAGDAGADGATGNEPADDRREEEATGGGFLAEDYAIELAPAEEHVEATLRSLRDAGIRGWFLLTPYYRAVFARHSKYAQALLLGGQADYSAWLERLGRELELPVLDLHYCQEISDHEPYFFDSRHLNGAGSEALGELLGKLYSGARPTPEAWLGTPSRAQRAAIFGHAPPATAPTLPTGVPQPLAAALGFGPGGKLLDAYARFAIERAGTYELVLIDRESRAHSGAYFVRLGPEPYRQVVPPGVPESRSSFGAFELEAGEQIFELHSRTGAPIDWDEVLVAPASRP